MADTTVDNVLAIAPHLSSLDDSTIDLYIEDAIEELKGTSLADNERAQRYLAAHYGTINVRRATSEEIKNELSVDYEDSGDYSTKYKQEFERLVSNANGIDFRLFS